MGVERWSMGARAATGILLVMLGFSPVAGCSLLFEATPGAFDSGPAGPADATVVDADPSDAPPPPPDAPPDAPAPDADTGTCDGDFGPIPSFTTGDEITVMSADNIDACSLEAGESECLLNCNSDGSCTNGFYTCDTDATLCEVSCVPDNTCRNLSLEAPSSGALKIKCEGLNSCHNNNFVCPANGNCELQCTGVGSCLNTTLRCPTSAGSCRARCTGDGACGNFEQQCYKAAGRDCDFDCNADAACLDKDYICPAPLP